MMPVGTGKIAINNQEMETIVSEGTLQYSATNPKHYRSHPSGVECIEITEHMNFNRGNAIKYIWRADEKGDTIENLRKAAWYIEREIQRIMKLTVDTSS